MRACCKLSKFLVGFVTRAFDLLVLDALMQAAEAADAGEGLGRKRMAPPPLQVDEESNAGRRSVRARPSPLSALLPPASASSLWSTRSGARSSARR